MTPDTGAPATTLLVLLVAGHVLGDFVLQTERMVTGKRDWRWMGTHVALVAAAQAAALFPFLSSGTLVVALAIAVSHGAIDAVKVRVAESPARLGPFALDQAAHGLSLIGGWLLLLHVFRPTPLGPMDGAPLSSVEDIGLLVAAYAFIGNGGSAIVRGLLGSFEVGTEEEVRGTGRVIGILERLLALTLVLLGEWGTLGLVLAAKSIARFKELEDRSFSEYYLIGTLASLLVAVGAGLLVGRLL